PPHAVSTATTAPSAASPTIRAARRAACGPAVVDPSVLVPTSFHPSRRAAAPGCLQLARPGTTVSPKPNLPLVHRRCGRVVRLSPHPRPRVVDFDSKFALGAGLPSTATSDRYANIRSIMAANRRFRQVRNRLSTGVAGGPLDLLTSR